MEALNMKIVVLDGNALNPGDISWDGLEKIGNLTVYDRTPADQISERIKGAEVIFTNKTLLTRETLEKAEGLKYIGVLATGYNVVDTDAAKELGIAVANVPTYGTVAVAQMATALLLEMCHHAGEHSDDVRSGAWSSSIDFCFWNHPLIELAGKNLGIIGFGRIGQSFAKVAEALGMNILALAHNDKPNKALESETTRFVTLDELLAQSDVISLHCPLFPSTEGIINKDSIAKMKDGVMIINTSRGPLIVEQDLADALNSGKVKGAALDVLSVEPPAKDNPLISAKNSIITPHIAWAPTETRARLMDIAVDNLEKFIAGTPQNIVNK